MENIIAKQGPARHHSSFTTSAYTKWKSLRCSSVTWFRCTKSCPNISQLNVSDSACVNLKKDEVDPLQNGEER